jgi:chromosome segregation ATPase
MSSIPQATVFADWSSFLPDVQLEVRQSNGRSTNYPVGEVDFLIGSLPGCDLRVGGTEGAGVLCLIARHPGGVSLRKLSLTQTILINGRSASHCQLNHEDRLQIGLLDMRIVIAQPNAVLQPAADVEENRRELQEGLAQLRDQVRRLQEDRANLEADRANFEEERTSAQQLHQAAADLEENRRELQKGLAQLHDQIRRLQEDRANLEADRANFEEERTIALQQPQPEIPPIQISHDEQALADGRRDLEIKLAQYQADVLRLDRWQGTLEQRERDIEQQKQELTRRREQLQNESGEIETQLRQIDEWRANLSDEADRLNRQKQEQGALNHELTERAAALEGQQATFAMLRSRMERMREEIRTSQQQLDGQRSVQDKRETELAQKSQDLLKLQGDLKSDQEQYERDRQQWLERSAVLDTAVRQIKDAQDRLAAEDERVRRAARELEERGRELLESEGVLQGRLNQIGEVQERLDHERQTLRDRSVALLEREQACANLQEQLRGRAEEIDEHHQETVAHVQEHHARIAAFQEQRQQLEERMKAVRQQIETQRLEIEQKALVLDKQQAEQAGFEKRNQERLDQIAAERQTLADEHARVQREREEALTQLAQARTDFNAVRADAQELLHQLPDVELRAGTAMERLAHARTQMREHLAEIHRYVRDCQDQLEKERKGLQGNLDKLQAEEQSLRRSQDEHRLALTAFRQQVIDSQGEIGELQRLLARDETRLERKQARVDERKRAVEAESERLARHAEVLDEQVREVAERRHEIDVQLVDMRDWYRKKLRDLAGIPLTPAPLASASLTEDAPEALPLEAGPAADDESSLIPTARSILSITTPVDAGDRQLGEVLRAAQLIDADTLTALLAEARRQRRSLRQVLLSSGAITLYQLALIEAGNTQGLMLGHVRVIDRLRQSAHEIVYRVFDPRRGTEAVLRHLAEIDMTDALRPDEFRQRFAQAMLNDPHVANTLEVFELAGRPAVLQEWLTGLAASDWPPLTAAPGVCSRLLTQAAQGLAAAHQAGLVHGHLGDNCLLLTGDGILKITGMGEPPWLIGMQPESEPTPRDDLRMLGTIVSGWCTPTGVRKGARTKPLPDALVSVLYRLAAEKDAGYRDVHELLDDLQKAAADIPANAEAWDRLLKYVREHADAEIQQRQSA